MSDHFTTLILALAAENTELRAQLAEAQELLVETAVDAGELHALIEDLQTEIAALRSDYPITLLSTAKASREAGVYS